MDPADRVVALEAERDLLQLERTRLEEDCRELREELYQAMARVQRDEATILAQQREHQLIGATLRMVYASRSWRLGAPLRAAVNVIRRLVGLPIPGADGLGSAFEVSPTTRKAVLIVSDCPGDAKRYRCDHALEQLESLGVSTEVALRSEVDFREVVDRFAVFVLHRVPYDRHVEWFLRRARATGRLVIFDTDDWVFDLGASSYVAALEEMTPSERALYGQGLVRYRETASRCDAMLVSTQPLAELAAGLLPGEAHVVSNAVSQEMMQLAVAACARRTLRRSHEVQGVDVTLGYFSGTPTHKRDFAEAADSIEWAMETYAEVRFLTVGHIDVAERFARFGDRFEHVPLQPWQRLSDIMTRVDVNLAPLERNNPFTASKSCLKYLEAAMVGLPTIATPVPDYRRVIEHGKNGLLADTPAAWREGLGHLIESRQLREEMGARARDDLIQRHTTQMHAPRLLEALRCVAQARQSERPLTINWILRAPIAGTGGGYWTIFRLANHLGAAGHHVRVYVEPVAHLEGRSREQIEKFLDDNFGPLQVEVLIGHDNLLPSDASIATNWPTAYTVARQNNALFRFYFVQDFEPEFYAERDPWYRKAERTYSLPLKHVCIGRSLAKRISRLTGRTAECIDFAVDTGIFGLKRAPSERPKPLQVLFFARPTLKRRGYALGVEALEIFARRRPDARILLFGAHDHEIRGVRFPFTNLGVLRHEELASAMNDAHIVLSFSLSANVSWVPLQAMACGAAVVEADVPGVREMVDDGETCVLVEPTAERVAEALVRLATEDRLRCQLASNAAASFADRTWESSAHQFERILLRQCFVRLPRPADEAARGHEALEAPPVAALSFSATASS